MSVRKYLAVGGHLRLMASPVLLLVVLLAAPASPAAGVGPDWRYWRKGLEPLNPLHVGVESAYGHWPG